MTKPLDHDEHQFVASGWLVAHAGLFPYRDYPYFHLPYLSLLYAVFYAFTTYPMLAARLIETSGALGSTILIYALLASTERSWRGKVIGAFGVIIFLFNPITEFTVGMSWNHDVAMFACLVAFAAFLPRKPSRVQNLLSGLAIAFAVGVRATFALASLVLAIFSLARYDRRVSLPYWLGGLFAGSLPNFAFFALAPAQFWFGNFTYAALNTEWRNVNEYERAMTLSDKVGYLLGDVIGWSSSLPLLLALFAVVIIAARSHIFEHNSAYLHTRAFWLAVALCLALGIAAFLPTPTFDQYFYSALPFSVLAVGFACISSRSILGVGLMSALAFVSVAGAPAPLSELAIIASPAQWTPIKIHNAGLSILPMTSQGPIVTLAPIYPLEAALTIFPELATGPFAYRVGPLMSATERQQQHVLDIDDLPATVDQRKPAAFLLGFEPEQLEEPIARYAQDQHYRYTQLASGKHLWVPP